MADGTDQSKRPKCKDETEAEVSWAFIFASTCFIIYLFNAPFVLTLANSSVLKVPLLLDRTSSQILPLLLDFPSLFL
jgi:hypothetical protein